MIWECNKCEINHGCLYDDGLSKGNIIKPHRCPVDLDCKWAQLCETADLGAFCEQAAQKP
jgi:hypothetical protein